MSRSGRVGRLIALVLIVAVLAGVAALWSPRPADAEGLISFRLPAHDGRSLSPDASDYAAAAPGHAPLLLFLPATGAHPGQYTRFLTTAHTLGYSVLGLDYWNLGPSLAHTCEGDMNCYGRVLRNRYDGSSPFRLSSVTSDDAILARLTDALGYLTAHDEDGRWGRYLDGTRVRWSDVVVAGHSQGGGEAAFIAHRERVRAALLFSAPAQSLDGRTATWLRNGSATPTDRIWALDDSGDVYRARILPTWQALGIPAGTPAPVPVGGHGLISSLALGNGIRSHGRVITDATPLDAHGAPVLAPTWRWMLREARAATAPATAPAATPTPGRSA